MDNTAHIIYYIYIKKNIPSLSGIMDIIMDGDIGARYIYYFSIKIFITGGY